MKRFDLINKSQKLETCFALNWVIPSNMLFVSSIFNKKTENFNKTNKKKRKKTIEISYRLWKEQKFACQDTVSLSLLLLVCAVYIIMVVYKKLFIYLFFGW